MPSSPDRCRGFTLLEVLVAFTLVAFVLAAALQLSSAGFRNTALAEQKVVATMLATSKLEELAAAQPLLPIDQSGVTASGYRWQASVRRHAEVAVGDADRQPVQLYEITVAIAWGGGIRLRTLELRTLRATVPPEAEGETEGGR